MNLYLNLVLGQAEAGNSGLSSIIMMVALFVIFYFFMIRPQKKRQKEIEDMRNNIKVGDAIVTSGGIHGKVKEINVTEMTMVIEIANNVCITVDKSSIFAAGTAQEAGK